MHGHRQRLTQVHQSQNSARNFRRGKDRPGRCLGRSITGREKSKGPGAGTSGRLESGEARGLSAVAAPTHGGADGQGTC